MDKITQEAYFRQRVLKYAAEHGVTASANRHRLSRKTVHKWKKRYDGTLESLKDRPRTPHHFPKRQKEDLLTKVKQKFQFQNQNEETRKISGRILPLSEIRLGKVCKTFKKGEKTAPCLVYTGERQ